MQKSNISIIIPAFNNSLTVGYCIENVLLQSSVDIELICIDDGSTDDSAKIVEGLACKDSRIKLIKQENQGAGVARNAGIRAAKGEYIAFMDADDYYPAADILDKLYRKAIENNANICGGSLLIRNGVSEENDFNADLFGNHFTKEGWVNFSDYQYDYAFYRFIYRREFLISNNLFFPDYRRYQDPPFMLRAFASAGRFYAVPDVTYCYRLSSDPIRWTTDKVLDLLRGIEDNLRFSAEHGFDQVHLLNYRRLCNDFNGIIANTALTSDAEGKILKKLISVQRSVAKQILLEYGMGEEEIDSSRPLSELVEKLSRLSVRVKEEGWFIDKKIFRLYTFPVRKLGISLRKKKWKKKK